MLKTLRLHNFRTFLNAEINFTQRHLLIGANNSGKTNLCAGLFLLRMTSSTDLPVAGQAVPGGVPEIKNRGLDSGTVELSCTCELPYEGHPHLYVYDLKLSIESSGLPSQEGQVVLRVAHEKLVVNGPGFNDVTLLENDGREAHMRHEGSDEGYTAKTLVPSDATMLSKLYELETNRRAISFRRYLSGWRYFALSPEHMRYEWRKPASGLIGLVPRGDNLAMVLFQLKNIDERRYRRVIDHVRLIEPDLEYINFIPAPDQAAVPLVAMRNQPRASWAGLSDGTLRCLALAFIAETAIGPLTMIEEPENGIYPGQLRAFFDLFEERTADAQVVFTSHSPYFINLFDGYRDSVTLLRRNRERTEIIPVPPAEDDPERELLAEQYSMELF